MNIGTEFYRSVSGYGLNSDNTASALKKSEEALDSKEKQENATGKVSDRVSLSKGVFTARKRESLGLPPTGKLTKSDFENLIGEDEIKVEAGLKKAMEKLGIKPDTKISLKLDSEGEISVSGSFEEKKKLQDLLGKDEEFSDSFKRLNTNSEIFDFTRDVQADTPGLNLLSMMDSGSDFTGLFKAISARYDQVSQSSDPLSLIAGYGRISNPYVFTHDPASS